MGPPRPPWGRLGCCAGSSRAPWTAQADVAATLELRGYAAGPPRRAAQPRPGRRSWRFAAAGLAILGLGIATLASGAADFDSYPTVSMQAGTATFAAALALPALAALPFARMTRFAMPPAAGVARG